MKILHYIAIGIFLVYALFLPIGCIGFISPLVSIRSSKTPLKRNISHVLISNKSQHGSLPPADSNIVESLLVTGASIESCPRSDSQFFV